MAKKYFGISPYQDSMCHHMHLPSKSFVIGWRISEVDARVIEYGRSRACGSSHCWYVYLFWNFQNDIFVILSRLTAVAMASFRRVNGIFDSKQFQSAAEIVHLQDGNGQLRESIDRHHIFLSSPPCHVNKDFIVGLGIDMDDRLNNNFAHLLVEYSSSVSARAKNYTPAAVEKFLSEVIPASRTLGPATQICLTISISCARNLFSQRKSQKA